MADTVDGDIKITHEVTWGWEDIVGTLHVAETEEAARYAVRLMGGRVVRKGRVITDLGWMPA